ncbi:glycine/betaine ABC transporter substrate-binding protein [Rubrobacter marinus]|uniref:Glycine/betaine ABC transporter substrate-binding protein n=1 Tax=Rubrobacter marinus TaxID=2653852 RepID=A0A6G8PWL2_9ACTN|nr:glycine betaine ABC transporter substrate-binding protein [Rubrobacter marinus]QIN78576.1 glycine/betaine ABC transporter substrate-binding protein [Rubrobacter marinus]
MFLRRKVMLAVVLGLFAGLLAAGCGGGQGGGSGSGDDRSLTIGYINWDEDVAVANLSQILLEEELDYEVELQLLDVGPLFEGVASGDLDAFQDVWLPTTHETYWNEFQDQVVDLGQWYEGEASLGIAVPEYAEARTIGDLAQYRDEFGGRIVGIEPGSGIMGVTKDEAVPAYGLDDYEVVDSSTPAMLGQVESSLENQEPIAFTAWKPHWMFTAYDIRYLEDPEGAMGEAEQLSAIAREGLEEDAPEAFDFLDKLTLNEEQLGELELAIQEAENPEEGTRAWLEENRDVVEAWLPQG